MRTTLYDFCELKCKAFSMSAQMRELFLLLWKEKMTQFSSMQGLLQMWFCDSEQRLLIGWFDIFLASGHAAASVLGVKAAGPRAALAGHGQSWPWWPSFFLFSKDCPALLWSVCFCMLMTFVRARMVIGHPFSLGRRETSLLILFCVFDDLN